MHENMKMLSGLTAGSPIFLEIERLKLKLTFVLIGLAPGRFLLVTVPKQAEAQPQTLYPLLYPGNHVVCYSMLPGVATAFKCHIIRFVMSPFPLLFLSYPEQCDCVDVRQHARIHCLFEAVLRAGQAEVKGMITDVSLGGCCFTFPHGEAKGELDFAKAAPVTLESWQLKAEHEHAVQATVQSTVTKADHKCVGLKFETVPDETYQTLERFITEAVRLGQER